MTIAYAQGCPWSRKSDCGSSLSNRTRELLLEERAMSHVIEKSQGLYLEDLHVGQRFASGTHHMDEAKIKEFAREFDPQPFHLDDAAARPSVFGGLAASGWHTAAVAMRLLVDGGLPLGNGIIGMGGDLAWPKPTRPGDTLHVESEILEILPSRSKPNQAIVKVRSTTLNQHGEPVHSFTSKCLVFKRPQSA
jgi:acyl dehydratase